MVGRARVVSLLLALAVPGALLVPMVALGQSKPKASSPNSGSSGDAGAGGAGGEKQNDPDNVTAISQQMELIAKANERFLAKDYTTAIDTYKKAVQISPRDPFGYFMLAQAYIATGNGPEAEAAITQAVELPDSKNVQLRTKVLFLAADIFERQKKWEQAKVAWQAYVEHTSKLGADAGAFPQTAAGRLKAIQRALDQDKAYAAVRERIQAEREAARNPPKK